MLLFILNRQLLVNLHYIKTLFQAKITIFNEDSLYQQSKT